MVDAVNERAAVEMGRNADIVLSNPAFAEAMGRMKADVVAAWKDCPVRDREGQLLLLQLAKLTDKFEAILASMVQGGKLAQHKIDIEAERNETRTQRFLRKVA
jgi:acetolactate synthase regulatory subunit